ncbi:MAG TPA: hypothetical protein VNQ99_09665, partial [Xanthobacteraceae bacterium]|nr:hypothetical protein [Xanthobacteraceae bacterium]
AVGDSDVRKLRTLVAYSRSFLNTRCVEYGRYCDANVTGVFVGWRGRNIQAVSGSDLLSTGLLALSFWDRKRESERLKSEVLLKLKTISKSLKPRPGDFSSNKMIVLGHSLGGNMLAYALRDQIKNKLEKHPFGHYFQAPLGDLVVLMNPASEAYNWTSLQEKIAKRVGRNIVHEGKVPSDRFEEFFAKDQRPNYISLTAACDWSADELVKEAAKTGKIECDLETSKFFPMGQAAALKWSPEQNRAIGHLDPEYVQIENRTDLKPGTRRVGTTHEFIVNEGAGIGTGFANAASPELSQCDVADGWLTKAIERGSRRRHWDSYFNDGVKDNILWVSRKKGYFGQFRHGLSLSGFGPMGLPSISPASSPFWNVRAFHSAMEKHGNYVGYPLWCSINQLVLDDVVLKSR